MEVKAPMDNMPDFRKRRLRNRMQKRLLGGLNSIFAVFLMGLLVLMLNYISLRQYVRFDLSHEQYFRLSDKTVSVLSGIREKLTVIVFIQPGHDIYQFVYDDVIQILREYEYASGNRIHVERIDPNRNLARSEEIMTSFQLDGPNVIILKYGDRQKVVHADELFEMDYMPISRGELPRKKAFIAEQVLSSAILAITQTRQPRVYFLQGHGERSFEDRDEYTGLSMIGREIKRDDIELLPLNFSRQNAIPDDADALIIAGPTRRYPAVALDRISAYLKRSGSLLLLLNSESDAGFSSLLRELGVDSVNNLVVDPTRTLSGFDVLISQYADHPVTRRLQNITSIFYWPRALPLIEGLESDRMAADKPKAFGLAFSSENSWAEINTAQRPYRFDPDQDIRGPLPLAVAIEQGALETLDMNIRPMRAVIFGDVDFISNSGLSGGNSDLFMNGLNWILERNDMLAISPKPVQEMKLLITHGNLNLLFWLVVVGIPSLSAMAGFITWTRRRR